MSRYRRPKGQYVRNTTDWFVELHMAGGEFQAAAVGQYSKVSLYNNATDGSMLHIVGAAATSAVATNAIVAYLAQGVAGTPETGDVARIVANLGQLAGQFYVQSTAAPNPNPPLWLLSYGTQSFAWPYDYPLAIMPPGYSLVAEGQSTNADVSLFVHWLVLGKNEGYF